MCVARRLARVVVSVAFVAGSVVVRRCWSAVRRAVRVAVRVGVVLVISLGCFEGKKEEDEAEEEAVVAEGDDDGDGDASASRASRSCWIS